MVRTILSCGRRLTFLQLIPGATEKQFKVYTEGNPYRDPTQVPLGE